MDLPRPQHIVAKAVPDVSAVNLPAEQELDALLEGPAGLGKTLDVVRLAVPPFETAGLPAKNAWLGEAAADEMMTGLTRVPGVTVLERAVMSTLIAERKRASADGSLAKNGKILGAQMIVLGRLVPEGNRLVLALRPVSVATATSAKGLTMPVDPDHMSESMDAIVSQFGADLGFAQAAAPGTGGLTGAAAEAAATARTLQYEGKLLEAQPFYARALAGQTTAWRYEADYLQLMGDLGMYDWVEARAKDDLSRIPVTPQTMCERTRMFLQKNRANQPIEDAREAVRMAASCGEPELIARSLFFLAFAMERVDFPMAVAANRRAAKILGDVGPWTRCAIDWQAADYDVTLGGDWHGSREQLFSTIGDRCAAAGNLVYASVALNSAADAAWLPSRRHELFARSLVLARQAGGQQLDVTAERAAAELRASGQPLQADALLLERIGARLNALAAIQGALPDDAEAIDDDLARQAGYVRKPGSPRTTLTAPEQLLSDVHRHALGDALRAWAVRTQAETTRQADGYFAIANKLAPAGAPPPAKLSLADIAAATKAPLRGGGVDVREAWNRHYEAYWAARAKDPAAAATLADALTKLASWYQSPAHQREAIRIAAQQRLDAGDPDGALAQIQVSTRYAKDDPSWLLIVNDYTRQAWEKKNDSAHALATRSARIDIARKVSPRALVDAEYSAGFGEVRTGAGDGTRNVAMLRETASELTKQSAWEPAAYALARAAKLFNEGHTAEGSAEAVTLFGERVALLDYLDDGLRSLEARAELLEAIDLNYFQQYRTAKAQLATDSAARSLVQQISDACDVLAASGRQRDAVRLVVKLIAVAPGVDALLAKSLEWSKSFEASAEYPLLVGKIHDQLSRVADDHATIVKEALAARDALRATSAADAQWEYSRIVAYTDGETAMWTVFDQCVSEATEVPLRAGCWWGLYYWINRVGSLDNRTKAQAALAVGLALVPAILTSLSTRDRMQLFEGQAMLSLFADDSATFASSVKTIETFYTVTTKNPYEWATSLQQLWAVARHRDPKVALDLAQRFAASGAAPATKAALYASFAETARTAGDIKAEATFLAEGKAAASGQAATWQPLYTEYTARTAVRAKDWKKAESAYQDVRAQVAQNSAEQRWLGDLDLQIAITRAFRRDHAGALAALDDRVKTAEAGGDRPCLDTQVLALAASVELAAGHCERGTALRAKAAQTRARCTHRSCNAGERVRCDDVSTAAFWKSENKCKAPIAGPFPLEDAD